MAYIGRDIEYGVLEKQTLTADSSTVAFDLTYISNANGLIVSVGGVVQEPNVAYTVLGSTLTFTAAPTTGDIVFVVYLGQEMTVSSVIPQDAIDYQVMTGNGSTTLTLNHSVTNPEDLLVTYNGVNQKPGTDYTVSGTTLTFTTAPPTGMKVLVYFMALAENTLWDGSVTNPKIVSMDASKLTGTLPASVSVNFESQYQDLSTLALHWASVDNKVAMNLTDDFIDHFQDSTGVDSTNSVNALVSSDEYVTSASELDTATNIALSSNDFDYTFSNSEHPVAGNPLGDHSIGAYWKATGSNNNISTLITLDGDFEITFTLAESNQSEFGVYAIDEDGTRTADQRAGMSSMTNSFWYRDESVTDFMIGSSAQSDTHTFADGSVVKIERVSGTIKVYDDDVVVHTYGTTYSGTMRFASGDPGPQEADYDNFKITDSAKIQRDGYYHETASASTNWGDGVSTAKYMGSLFKATRTGNITGIKINITSVTTAFNGHYEIWSSDGTNPVSQIGSDSETINLNSAGEKTFVLNVPIEKGTVFWAIGVDEGTSGNVLVEYLSGTHPNGGYGQNDTLTSLTAHHGNHNKIEAIIEATGEPTPDHDTLLLVQSDTTNGSQTFVDSSQNARTVTVGGDSQHSTAQSKFGASSMYFDGTGDYLSVPDDDAFNLGTGDFTMECWYRPTAAWAGNEDGILSKVNSDATWSGFAFSMYRTSGNIIRFQMSDGSSGATVNTTTAVSSPQWYHLCVVRSSGVMKFYVNGTSENTTTSTLNMTNNTNEFYIGRKTTVQGYYADAHIDEVRISRVARWDSDFTPPTAPYGTATNTTLSATGSLVSTASTADSTVSEVTGALLVKDSVGTNTIGTDLKAYFSADNGSNWTEAASYGSPTTFDGTTNVIPLGKTTLSNTGTAVKMKAEWANQQASSKIAQLHGWAVNY